MAIVTQTTSTGTLADEIKTFYDRTLLERAQPQLTHARFAQQRPIGRRQGKTIEFRKFTALAPNVTPLTEGVTPDGKALTVTAITAAINQYGDFVQGSDLLDLVAIDPVLQETAELLGEQAGLTVDRIVRDVIHAGTSVNYASTASSRVTVAAGMNLTVLEIRRAMRNLRTNNAKPAAGRNFVSFIHPRSAHDVMSDTAWRNPHEYQDTENVYDGEIGRLYGVTFFDTTEAKTFPGAGAAAIDVYSTLVVGANAYGVIPLEGQNLDFVFKPIGSAGAADPLEQRWTSGWKVAFAARILDDLAMVRIEHAVSA